ncbi:MAG: PQQ-binding-like beta-propeller repeat protein, partial [Chloroflexi bacterium]|nr:PQQ-binding-like beta-propeller repeat protein [Chloroflexota bacterium]
MHYGRQSQVRSCLGLLLFLFLLLARPGPGAAQSPTRAYWRYDAPGRLNHLLVHDVNQDGIDEFIVVAGNTNVTLVGSDGRARWTASVQISEPIRQLAALDIADNLPAHDEIAVGTAGQLMLFSDSGEKLWQRPLGGALATLTSFDLHHDGETELLTALTDGRLFLFNGQGEIIWRYAFSDTPDENAVPHVEVADVNRDGQQEIIFSYFNTGGFGKLVLINADGSTRWERSNNGQNIILTLVEFDPEGPLEIAVGTSLNQIYLYTANGQYRWPYRTPNKPITSLTMAQLVDGPALIVGTAAGTVIAYDQQGRRYWSWNYYPTSDHPVLAVSSVPSHLPESQPVSLAVVSGRPAGNVEPADVLLLDSGGRQLESYPEIDTAGLSRLVDVNRDGRGELLLAGFASLELIDPGIGVREYSAAWDYNFEAEPRAVRVADIDRDGQEELLVSTTDGILYALKADGSLLWQVNLGGVVSHITLSEGSGDTLPNIVAVHNNVVADDQGGESFEGWVEVLRPDGRSIIPGGFQLPSIISSLLVGDINRSGQPEIIVGTVDGQILAYSLAGNEFWRTSTNASIHHLILLSGIRNTEILVSTRANTIDRFNNKGTNSVRTAEYLQDISALHLIDQAPIDQENDSVPQLLVAIEDGTLRGLNARGNQLWEVALGGLPVVTLPADNSLLVATDESELLRIDFDGNILWRIPSLGRITTLYWGDLDGDVRPDVAVGNREHEVRLITGDGASIWGRLDLASELFYVTAFRNTSNQQAELIAVTDTGKVQLFRAQANRPPLLVNPQTEVSPGSYNISVSIIDVENDNVTVELELYDAEFQVWRNEGRREASSGNNTLFWAADPPEGVPQVRYRFHYDDGSHEGWVEPAAGPAALLPNPLFANAPVLLMLLVIIAGGGVFLARQASSPAAQVGRFYQRVKQQPFLSLELLDAEYSRTGGSPDFLLNLANKARLERNYLLASLADGLFLLAARPEAALPIITNALDEATQAQPEWRQLQVWRLTYRAGQDLLATPSITELSLLRAPLVQLLSLHREARRQPEALEGLLPVVTCLRDGERVDLVEDRLLYLNEAIGLLKQLLHRLNTVPVQIENVLVEAIAFRWQGLINAEIEDLRGRAQLIVNLKTRRLVPKARTVVAVEIQNAGRAPAEQVTVTVEENPAYLVVGPPQTIPFLPAGRKRQVQFTITPQASEHFRLAFTIHYDDRHTQNKKLAFADMVHLLAPAREFQPVVNPYSPGTPLRRNSVTFFGREELFRFIVENAGRPAQQSVLILVGQRRTGKTSALLQLDQHLPSHLFPIYIDCQSLGVAPGMPALLHDLAWTIADGLGAKGYELPVAEPAAWQEDPAGRFQRHFIPQARSLLPAGTVLLLIFDEFEAFENLVKDGILPPTFFAYLR